MALSVKTEANDGAGELRSELAARIRAAHPEDGLLEIFPGVYLARTGEPTNLMHTVYSPCFCVIARGSKTVNVGSETFTYDEGHYLIATMDLPTSSCVVEASKDDPYLSIRIDLDPTLVAQVLIDSGIDATARSNATAMNVSAIDAELLDASLRLIKLLDTPADAEFMLPLLKRELIYRLLKGNQAARLTHLISNGENRRISRAIDSLRENFDQPIRIENIARELGMSVSGFHHHFKSVTAMSPLQFQKQIRLQEARRLMLGEDMDAATAGFRVGYEDPSYFSREYKKQFGAPPQRDIARLRTDLGS